MNKGIIIAGIVFLIVLGGVVFFVTQSPQKKDEASSVVQENQEMMKNSRYVPYTKAAYEQGKDIRRVLYFYASWCPICRPADTDFQTNASRVPEDTVVIRVNYNDPETDEDENDLAKKYGITYQHTFVQIDSQGKEVTKWNGGKLDELLANIK